MGWKMNNEQKQIINEVYKNYSIIAGVSTQVESLTKEEFINKCKTDNGFTNTWGLKIEEREILKQIDQSNPMLKGSTTLLPTKLITITYKDTIIESYE
jgi:predicted metal-dependent peptidase